MYTLIREYLSSVTIEKPNQGQHCGNWQIANAYSWYAAGWNVCLICDGHIVYKAWHTSTSLVRA